MSARQITGTLTLPDGDVFTFRKLSAKQLRRAAEAQMFEQAELVERIRSVQDRLRAAAGPEPAPAEVKSEPAPETPAAAPVAVDPLMAYDRHALVRFGCLTVNGASMSVEGAAEWADDLGLDDLEAASRAVLKLATPKAFLTDAERAEEQKNG